MTRALKIVVAGILEQDGKILVSQRLPHEHLGLNWEFPGGKLQDDEDPREALQRELLEELGVTVEVVSAYDVSFFRYENFNVLLIFYRCRIAGGEPQALEVHDFRWVTPAEMRNLVMPPADQPLVERLISERLP